MSLEVGYRKHMPGVSWMSLMSCVSQNRASQMSCPAAYFWFQWPISSPYSPCLHFPGVLDIPGVPHGSPITVLITHVWIKSIPGPSGPFLVRMAHFWTVQLGSGDVIVTWHKLVNHRAYKSPLCFHIQHQVFLWCRTLLVQTRQFCPIGKYAIPMFKIGARIMLYLCSDWSVWMIWLWCPSHDMAPPISMWFA
jgi:hypothetical protein